MGNHRMLSFCTSLIWRRGTIYHKHFVILSLHSYIILIGTHLLTLFSSSYMIHMFFERLRKNKFQLVIWWSFSSTYMIPVFKELYYYLLSRSSHIRDLTSIQLLFEISQTLHDNMEFMSVKDDDGQVARSVSRFVHTVTFSFANIFCLW